MSKLAPEEFRDHLLKHIDREFMDDEDIYYSNFDITLNNYGHVVTVPPVEPTMFTVNIVAQNEYHNECNSSLYVIFEVTHTDGSIQYFKKTGYYQSHVGEYWDGAWTEVHPETKTVTVWTDNESTKIYDDSYSF